MPDRQAMVSARAVSGAAGSGAGWDAVVRSCDEWSALLVALYWDRRAVPPATDCGRRGRR
jgi:hypothetical protein